MSFAKVIDNNITKLATRLPQTAQRLDDDGWVLALRTADTATQEACGWFQVDDAAVRPDDTATATSDRSVELVGDVPTVIWTVRSKSDAELAGDTAAAAEKSTRDAAVAAHGANKDFLALDPPTTAQALQQVNNLTRQVNGLIRLVVDAGLAD
jgi:hypothetical protein